MHINDFVQRWGASHLREQQAAQSHFNELCQVIRLRTEGIGHRICPP